MKEQTIKLKLRYRENKNIISSPTEVILPYEEYEELQAESDRRLVLLRQIEEWAQKVGDCPICCHCAWDGEKLIHADDCELAEELK